jgi:DNA-binding transcriptional MerR regulator
VSTQDDLPIYPIRTVASLTGVDARRLRSWESEYHLLEPARSKGGHRLYSPRDLRLVHLIRRLVDQEGMSLQGIKAYLEVHADGGVPDAPAPKDDGQRPGTADGPAESAPASSNGMPVGGTRLRNGQHGRAERA